MKASKPQSKPAKGGKREGPSATGPGAWRWVDPATLKVDPSLRRLIPLQSREELHVLEQSILAEGCRDPLDVWKGHNIVLDGHTRRELCIKHHQRVPVREVELPDREAAVAYLLEIQRRRRNLTYEALCYLRGAEYNARKQRWGGVRPPKPPPGQAAAPTTARLLADKYGVSEKTVKRDAKFAAAIDQIVAEYGDPEIRRRLLCADARLTRWGLKRLLKQPPNERKVSIDYLIAHGKLPPPKPAGRAEKARAVAQTLLSRLQARGKGHARAVVQQMVSLLDLEDSEEHGG